MSRPDSFLFRAAFGLVLALTTPLLSAGQERAVVANEIAVSSDEASLRLEFADGEALAIQFQDGMVFVDGDQVGEYERGDALDAAWRALLGETLSLSDGALAEALVAWFPPDGLEDNAVEVAGALDRALEEALTYQEAPVEEAAPALQDAPGGTTVSLNEIIRLVTSQDRLMLMASALDGLEMDELELAIDEDLVIGEGQELDGSVLVIGGDLELSGTITGDAVVVGGSARLLDGGLIEGDLRLAEARLFRDGGVVEGRIADVDPATTRDMIRDEIRAEVAQSIGSGRAEGRDRGGRSFLGNIGSGIGGIMENLVTFAILLLVAAVVTNFAPERVDVIAETFRQAPARSMVVGVSGAFLFLPVWVLGIVVLAVSIIGIPVLIAWIPGLPVISGVAAALGFLAVSRTVGEWIADREFQGLDWIRKSHDFSTIVAGIGFFMAFPVVANILGMGGPLLGVFRGMVTTLGVMVLMAAIFSGFGAVLLSRGGRRRVYADGVDFDFDIPTWSSRRPWRSAWETAEKTRRQPGTTDNGPRWSTDDDDDVEAPVESAEGTTDGIDDEEDGNDGNGTP